MTFGDFLHKLFDWVGALIPFRLVQQWERGVRMLFGRTRTELGPGLHFFWPLAGDILTVNAVPRVVELDHQTVTLENGKSLTFSLTVRYSISSAKKLYESIFDPESTLADAVRSVAGHIAAFLDGDETGDAFAVDVMKGAAAEVEEWGIDLHDVGVVNFAVVPALRLMLDAPPTRGDAAPLD